MLIHLARWLSIVIGTVIHWTCFVFQAEANSFCFHVFGLLDLINHVMELFSNTHIHLKIDCSFWDSQLLFLGNWSFDRVSDHLKPLINT